MIKDEAGPIWLELSVYSKKRVWLNTAECRAAFRVQMTFSSIYFWITDTDPLNLADQHWL